ncbi:MAG: zf-HC2 domain-containing protein [Gemmatimonadaceae bacterium]
MARLFELLDGELTPEVERQVRSHITSCPDCFTHADFEKRFLAALHAAKAGGAAPKQCRERVMTALRTAGFTG